MTRNRAFALQIVFALLPILLSLAITAILILVVGANPLEVFNLVWEGAFRDARSFAQVVNFWIPLALVSMGLVVTFTAGLWNIGVEGQMMMGAVFASWGALTLTEMPSLILIPVEILLAAVGGALWAALVGVLKTRLGVHEIFGGVALNALANVFSIYMISGPWQPPEGGSVRATPPFRAEALLPYMSEGFKVSLLALVIAGASIVLVILALRGTLWGLQLKATGKNARSALLLGVPTGRSALSAFVFCGALAGIAGSYRVLFTYGSLRPLISGGIGFLGLLVVLLVSIQALAGTTGGQRTRFAYGSLRTLISGGIGFLGVLLARLASARALWAPLVAFGFAAILGGSTRLKVALQLDASLAGVLQGTLVLIVLLFNGLRQRWGESAGGTEDLHPTSADTQAAIPETAAHE